MSLREYRALATMASDNDERGAIITSGRILCLEHLKRALNMDMKRLLGDNFLEFKNDITDSQYAECNHRHKKTLINFCSKLACDAAGMPWEDGRITRSMSQDAIFLRALSGVITEIVTPVQQVVMSDILGKMAKFVNVPHGQTYEVEISSNQIFVFQDTAWGSIHSVPKNYIYPDVVTLNPVPKAAKATVKWAQIMGSNFDMGQMYNGLMLGLYSKIMGMFTQAFMGAIENRDIIPPYLVAHEYTTANLTRVAYKTAMANGVNRNQLAIVGTYPALKQILPTGTNATALTYGLGGQWMSSGYLNTVDNMAMIEVGNAFMPNTVNSTGEDIFPNDIAIIMAMNGDAPMYVALEEGEPITVEFMPDKTADMTLEATVIAPIDVKPVFGSKIGVIKNMVF